MPNALCSRQARLPSSSSSGASTIAATEMQPEMTATFAATGCSVKHAPPAILPSRSAAPSTRPRCTAAEQRPPAPPWPGMAAGFHGMDRQAILQPAPTCWPVFLQSAWKESLKMSLEGSGGFTPLPRQALPPTSITALYGYFHERVWHLMEVVWFGARPQE